MATQEASYTVLKNDGNLELRQYDPQVLAEIIIKDSMEDAGNKAFSSLFRYITGDNTSQSKIAMTTPVSLENKGEKISMTAPVSQERKEGSWAVSFMMPSTYTLETLPTPNNKEVKLRAVPARQVAAIKYSGFWSEESYLSHKKTLEEWISKNKLTITGEAIWARYNAPFTPWFLRRNEVLIPVSST